MLCPQCQAECEPEAIFCHQCACRLIPDEAPQTASAQSTASAATPHEQFQQSVAAGHSNNDDEEEIEEEIWRGSFSKKGMIGSWIMASVGTVVAIAAAVMFQAWLIALGLVLAVWGVLIAWYGYRRLSVHYTLTSQRLIHESGVLWRTIDRIELIDIDDVTFKQGPVERVFRVGTIVVISGDKTSPELSLPGIDNVRGVADEIDDARRKERRRRGLHMITQGA